MESPVIDVGESRISVDLGAHAGAVSKTLRRLDARHVVQRIRDRDHTVWKPNPRGIADRLGWLDLPSKMGVAEPAINAFADRMLHAGYRYVVLLGMGGSISAADVLGQVCGHPDLPPKLVVLDTTIPESIREATNAIDPAQTLFIVSSKSGTTIEPNALYSYFRDVVEREIGRERAGVNFVAITDADTPLERMARVRGFRRVFIAQPDIGGRYSALSHFGLVPAALRGVDIRRLLERALSMARMCLADSPSARNPGALLGAAIGTLAVERRDKLTVITSPSVVGFGRWIDQLIAESTGKDAVGIVPVVDEPALSPSSYGDDRAFVYLRMDRDRNESPDEVVNDLRRAGHPVIVVHLRDGYDLGAEFFRWEFATAIASSILGIHPFDQPNVQASKQHTNTLLHELETSGSLPDTGPTGSLDDLMRQARPEDYLAIMPYVHPTPEADFALSNLRRDAAQRHRIATTLEYGPRLLHSAGQLHKGGPDTGLFLQITSEHVGDIAIPGKPFSFGALAAAQSAGDFRALRRLGRRVVRVNAGSLPGLTPF